MVLEMCRGVLRRTVRCRTFTEVLFGIVIACFFGVFAVRNLRDPEFGTQIYCQINNLQKPGEDKIDTVPNICNSSIVLDYKPEDLEADLHATSYLHAIFGFGLVITGVVALVGLWRTDARLIVPPWLVANILWAVTIVITVALLHHYGFHVYANVLLVPLFVSALSLLDVGNYCWNIPRQGSYDFKLRRGSCDLQAVSMQYFGDETGNNIADVAVKPRRGSYDLKDVSMQNFGDETGNNGADVAADAV